MKKLLSTIAIASLAISFLPGCCHHQTEKEKAEFVADYLEKHLNKANKDFVTEKNFDTIVVPVIQQIVNANRYLRGVDDPPSISNHSLFIRDTTANALIRRFIDNPYRNKDGVCSYLISADSLLLYMEYAKSQNTPIAYFRMMHATFDSAGKPFQTVVFAGLDEGKKYILYKDNTVLEHCLPCPDQCPEINNVKISDYIKN